jgi:Arc/MetJ family transcription regulator
MDELIQTVARAARLSPEQAALAVAAMLRFFTARLSSALVGELHARLDSLAGPATRSIPIATPDHDPNQ